MRSKRTKWFWTAAAVALAGMLNFTACAGFAGDQLMSTVDFCFLFDCQNGAFGGLLDPCPNQTVTTTSSGQTTTETTVTTTNLFVDCPTTTTTTGGG